MNIEKYRLKTLMFNFQMIKKLIYFNKININLTLNQVSFLIFI